MNTKNRLRTAVCICTLAVAMALPVTAFAADIDITASSTSVKKGDAVTVTVTVSDQHIAVANGIFTYDPTLLSYTGSNGGASDGYVNLVSAQKGGSSSLTAVINFKAVGAGDAEIRVTMQSILDYDGNALTSAEAGLSISIAAADTPAEPGESAEAVDISQTGVAAGNVTGVAEQMYIWRSLSSLTLPNGYADRQVTYKGEYVGGAAIPDTEDIILLYLSTKTGESAGYYVYDEQRDVLFPYRTLSSVSKGYTLIWPDDCLKVPEGYEQTTLVWDKKEAPAWIQASGDGTVYLVYARDSSGERAWYLYDSVVESMQRFIPPAEAEAEPAVAPTAAPEDKPAAAQAETETLWGIRLNSTLFIALALGCALMTVLAAVFMALLIKSSRTKRKAADMEKRYKKGSGEVEVASYRFGADKDKEK